MYRPSLIKRFYDKVLIDSSDKCWEWQASISPKGYGQISVNDFIEGAHRVAWTIWFGDIPQRMVVAHKCDNKTCVNHNHLELITYSKNNQDAYTRGLNQGNIEGKH